MKTVRFQSLIDEGVLQIGDGYRAKMEELTGTGYPFLRGDCLIEISGLMKVSVFTSRLLPNWLPNFRGPGTQSSRQKGTALDDQHTSVMGCQLSSIHRT